MITEKEPREIVDNRPTFKVGKFDVPVQPWYTNRDIASIIGKPPRYGSKASRIAREENPDIQVSISSKAYRTHRYDRENLEKVLTFIASQQDSPHKSRKAGKPQRPSNFNDLSLLDDECPPPTPKDAQTIRTPHLILAVNSVKDILAHLSDGTLSQVTPDLRSYLEETYKKHVKDSTFETKYILMNILWDNSAIRLKGFFHTSLHAYLDSLWGAIDGHQTISTEEREIIEICSTLKNKDFNKEKVFKELSDYFQIQVPPEQLHAIAIVPNSTTIETPAPAPLTQAFLPELQAALPPAPICKEITIFEPIDVKQEFDPRLYSTPKGKTLQISPPPLQLLPKNLSDAGKA